MRKHLPCTLFILFVCQTSFSQEGLLQLSKNYFRSDPFTGEFSSFLTHLINDPAINNKEIHRRTDSSLFYFSGIYNNYNPFFFKPKKIEITLEEISVQYVDSLPPDTIFVYHLSAYADGNDKGEEEVKKEFSKIHRHYNKKFDNSNYRELKTGSVITGAAHNYFLAFSGLAPLSIAWGKPDQSHEYVLSIILRMKTSQNRTILAAPLYHSQ